LPLHFPNLAERKRDLQNVVGLYKMELRRPQFLNWRPEYRAAHGFGKLHKIGEGRSRFGIPAGFGPDSSCGGCARAWAFVTGNQQFKGI